MAFVDRAVFLWKIFYQEKTYNLVFHLDNINGVPTCLPTRSLASRMQRLNWTLGPFLPTTYTTAGIRAGP